VKEKVAKRAYDKIGKLAGQILGLNERLTSDI